MSIKNVSIITYVNSIIFHINFDSSFNWKLYFSISNNFNWAKCFHLTFKPFCVMKVTLELLLLVSLSSIILICQPFLTMYKLGILKSLLCEMTSNPFIGSKLWWGTTWCSHFPSNLYIVFLPLLSHYYCDCDYFSSCLVLVAIEI